MVDYSDYRYNSVPHYRHRYDCIPDVGTKYVIKRLMSIIMSSMYFFPNTEQKTEQRPDHEPTAVPAVSAMPSARSQDLNSKMISKAPKN